MLPGYWLPLISSLLAAAVTTAGIVTIRRYEAWALANAPYFACFASGIRVTVSFLHIVPNSIRLSTSAPGHLPPCYLAMHLFNRFVTAVVCDRPPTKDYAIGIVPKVGIGVHSFIDGIIATHG